MALGTIGIAGTSDAICSAHITTGADSSSSQIIFGNTGDTDGGVGTGSASSVSCRTGLAESSIQEIVKVTFDAGRTAATDRTPRSEVVALNAHPGGLVDVVARYAIDTGGGVGAGDAGCHPSACVTGQTCGPCG